MDEEKLRKRICYGKCAQRMYPVTCWPSKKPCTAFMILAKIIKIFDKYEEI